MHKRQATVTAQTEQAARALASDLLNTGPDNLEITPDGPGAWKAALRNADAEFAVEISHDHVEATVVAAAPPLGDGSPLTPERLRLLLTEAGVVLDPDEAAIPDLVERVNQGEDVRGIVIARGTEPVAGVDARIEVAGDITAPVLPGMLIGHKIEPVQPVPGRGVDGTEIPPPGRATGKDLTLDTREGCHVEERDGQKTLVADAYGLVHVAGGRVSVEPAIAASEDRMRVTATVYPRDFSGNPLDGEALCKAANAIGVQATMNESGIRDAIEVAEASSAPAEHVTIATGRPPRNGEDGRLDLAVDTSQSVGEMQEDGRVDFRERGTVHAVQAGVCLGRVVPPTKGTPGEDVFGQPLPASDGEPVSVTAGENVRYDETEEAYYAEIDGMVLYARGMLAVTEVFEVHGDVDFACGNVRTEKGSVSVTGTIREGFEVETAGNLVVGESIENAWVRAEGNIEVHRGILMYERDGSKDDPERKHGIVESQGSITAHFAQNARIRAAENVFIDNDITNCEIEARGKVEALKGKGRIQGGSIRCGEGLEANEIGSELGVVTNIFVGFPPEGHEELTKKKHELTETARKITRVLGEGDPRTILIRTPPAKRKAVAQLLKALIQVRKQAIEVDTQLEALKKETARQAKSRVKVHRIVHPGVNIHIGGVNLTVSQAVSNSQFYYDRGRNAVQWAPL